MSNVRPVSLEQLDKLGVDEDNRLYWNGQPVILEEKLTLQWWINVSAVLGALSGVTLAVIEVLRFSAGQ